MTNRELDQRRRQIVANRATPPLEQLARAAVAAHPDEAPLVYLRVRLNDSRWDEADWFCPLCTCRKNGSPDEANGHDPGCADDDCRCHDEYADEYQECFEHPDRVAVVETAVGPVGGVFRWQPICNTCRVEWAVEPCRALTW